MMFLTHGILQLMFLTVRQWMPKTVLCSMMFQTYALLFLTLFIIPQMFLTLTWIRYALNYIIKTIKNYVYDKSL